MWPVLMAAPPWSTGWLLGQNGQKRTSSLSSLKPWRAPGCCCMQKASGTTASAWCWTKAGCCSTTNKVGGIFPDDLMFGEKWCVIGRRSFFQEKIRHFWCIPLNAEALVISMKTRGWQGNWNSFMWKSDAGEVCVKVSALLLARLSVIWCFGGTWTLFSNNDDPRCAWTILGGFSFLVLKKCFCFFLPLDRLVFPLLLSFSHNSWCNYGKHSKSSSLWEMIPNLADSWFFFSSLFHFADFFLFVNSKSKKVQLSDVTSAIPLAELEQSLEKALFAVHKPVVFMC